MQGPMNLPNYITLLRVVLIPFFIDSMVYGYYRTALLIFAVASLTDALDGMIARMMGSKTDFGAFFDPVADKLLIVSAFLTLAALGMLPLWLVIIVVSRDVILVLGSIVIAVMGQEFKAMPSLIGKATTALQFAVVVLSLLMKNYEWEAELAPGLYGAAALFTLFSGVQYIARGVKIVGHVAR